MAGVDGDRLGVAGCDDVRVVGRGRDDLRVSRIGRVRRVNRLVVLDNEHGIGHIGLATLRGHRHWNFGVVARLSVGRRRGRNRTVLIHGRSPAGRERTNLVGVALGTILDVLGRRLSRLG